MFLHDFSDSDFPDFAIAEIENNPPETPAKGPVEVPAEFPFTDEQLSAIEMVKTNSFSILTGGPGTGKSTTLKQILSWAESQRLSVYCAAPTGKAAKRMMEVTGRHASTIHSLLGAQMDDGEFSFGVNEESPLTCDFLIIDEVSMVPNELMADVMRAIDEKKTKVLLVGDQGQLPSVGAGAVLRDLLASKFVPHTELTKIHRNSGEIVKACHTIHKGKPYAPCTKLDVEAGYNLRHIETSSAEAIQDVIQQLFPKMQARGFDPIWDVQVLSPTNSRSILSCDGLNDVLQNQLNPFAEGQPAIAGTVFRTADKVIQIKNLKMEDIRGNPTFLVNGDMGQVLEISEDQPKMIVKFFDPERIVAISKKKNDLLRAYCITCHRAQGSEAPVIIVPVHKTFQFILTRNWIYTAISRAKVMCFTVGQFSAIEAAIKREEMSSRHTMLAGKIIDNVMILEDI